MKYYYILHNGKLHRANLRDGSGSTDFDISTIKFGEMFWTFVSDNPNMTVEEAKKKQAAP